MNDLLLAAPARQLALSLARMGAPQVPVRFSPCPRPEIGDAATSVAMQAAHLLGRSKAEVAQELARDLSGVPGVEAAAFAPPGFVNVRFSAEAVAGALRAQDADPARGVPRVARPERIVADYGGPNIKPMHVGHMRSLFVGESLRRILAAVGHDVVSDIHLGDWGLPSGMILGEARRLGDAAGAADPGALAALYPQASAACAADPARLAEARALTAALQAGDPELSAAWASIVASAKERILATCSRMGARFDLTLGESDAQPDVAPLLASLEARGLARRDGEALLMDLARPGDKHEVPPMVLAKEDGSALYATTDLATALARVRDLGAERILYVVDARQSLHFLSLARASALAGLLPEDRMEHVGFGTVNGPDGKPFRTRDGGTMPLEALLDLARDKARERLVAGGRMPEATGAELDAAADAVGLAALRIADLSANRTTGYALDLDRALSFEGKTGPHLLYALVRLRAILAKAGPVSGTPAARSPAERRLALACLGLGAAVSSAAAARAPHELVAYAFSLAAEIGRFYVECPVLSEPDGEVRAARVALCASAERCLSRSMDLLGCEVPPAM